MTRENAQHIMLLLKQGRRYQEDIFEGSITIEYRDGVYHESQYQHNPYSGNDHKREYDMNDDEFLATLLPREYAAMLGSICQDLP